MKFYNELKGQSLFKDNKGLVTVWQAPNGLLWGWIILKALSLVVKTGHLGSGIAKLSTAVIFAWAYLEVTKGVNIFRRVLGLVVLTSIALAYFK